MHFLNSNLIPLRLICYEPLTAIRDHINNSCPELMNMVRLLFFLE